MPEPETMDGLARVALDHLKQGAYAMGPHWEAAHEICQAHEGVQIMDRLHAFCHRIEGDHANAAYWDRRGGQATPQGDFADEWVNLTKMLA